MNVSWYSVFMVLHIFIFLFRTTVKKNTWMKAISVTVTVFGNYNSKSYLISTVQSSFSTITRHIDNGNEIHLTVEDFRNVDQLTC